MDATARIEQTLEDSPRHCATLSSRAALAYVRGFAWPWLMPVVTINRRWPTPLLPQSNFCIAPRSFTTTCRVSTTPRCVGASRLFTWPSANLWRFSPVMR